jgi:membrane protein implicated in regulation of membrane protease activity
LQKILETLRERSLNGFDTAPDRPIRRLIRLTPIRSTQAKFDRRFGIRQSQLRFVIVAFNMVWFLIGASLCLLEAVFPTAFVALVAGVSALIVAFVGAWLPIGLQILLWLVLSGVGIWCSRGFVDQRAARQFDAKDGTMITDLRPGQVARVLYEGNSWSGRCEDPTIAINAGENVLVVGRRGTTLLILPESDPRH